MDAARANALHLYFTFAQKEAQGELTVPVVGELIMLKLAATGVSFFEADALLAIAQHPFASEWARERYGS